MKKPFVAALVSGFGRLNIRKMSSTGYEFIPDLPRGRLDAYRQQASFSWKKLIVLIDGEDAVRLRVMRKIIFYPLVI